MYDYWSRSFVNERLRLAVRQSYRLVPATASGRIRSDGVLLLLNRARVGIRIALDAAERPPHAGRDRRAVRRKRCDG